MNPAEDREQQLERLAREALGNLPLRRAPASLHQRVMEKLHERLHLPWWRRSFRHWPLAAKLAFLLASAGVAKLILDALPRLGQALEPTSQSLQDSMSLLTTMTHVAVRLLEVVPSKWIQVALVFGAVVYVLFFALSAFAYRALYVPNRPSGFSNP